MRQYKFRGKRLDNGDWVYGSLRMSAIKAPYILWADGDIVIKDPIISQESIGQFTGLLDRNGKEIYEGDILRGALHNHVVKFKNGIFFAEVEDVYGYDCIEPTLFKATEVMGNIHDNPELMGNERTILKSK